MAYVAVKGGERAIDAAHAWLADGAARRPVRAASSSCGRSKSSSAARSTG